MEGIRQFQLAFNYADHAELVKAKTKLQLANPDKVIGWATMLKMLADRYNEEDLN